MEDKELSDALSKAFDSKSESVRQTRKSAFIPSLLAATNLNDWRFGFSNGEAYRQYMWGRPFDKKPESNRAKKLAAKAEKQRAKRNKA